MIKSIFASLCILFLVTSCKTVSVNKNIQNITKKNVIIGTVGIDKNIILKHDYNNTAMPHYKKGLQIEVVTIPFTKQIYNAFIKAKAFQPADVNIIYSDSLKEKPKFLHLQINNNIALLDMLNNTENTSIKNYLSINKKASIVANVSLLFSQDEMLKIINADDVHLIENKLNNFVLQLYSNEKPTETINFNRGIVFAYQTFQVCWQENKKYQLQIVDLVKKYNKCSSKTYKVAKRAKKKINYFKL